MIFWVNWQRMEKSVSMLYRERSARDRENTCHFMNPTRLSGYWLASWNTYLLDLILVDDDDDDDSGLDKIITSHSWYAWMYVWGVNMICGQSSNPVSEISLSSVASSVIAVQCSSVQSSVAPSSFVRTELWCLPIKTNLRIARGVFSFRDEVDEICL